MEKSNTKNIVCIIQARTGSTRLPSKILMKIAGKEMLLHVIDRVLNAKKINKIVIATTTDKKDDCVETLLKYHKNPKVSIFRGSEEDVLDRFYNAAKKQQADVIVRITADCPLIDWEIIDQAVNEFCKGGYDYVSNVLPKRTFPRGLDTEVFSFGKLEEMWRKCKSPAEREHVTTYIREHPEQFSIKNIINPINLSQLRWTVDEKADFELVERIYAKLYEKNKRFKTKDILGLFERCPELIKINEHVEQKKDLKNEAN